MCRMSSQSIIRLEASSLVNRKHRLCLCVNPHYLITCFFFIASLSGPSIIHIHTTHSRVVPGIFTTRNLTFQLLCASGRDVPLRMCQNSDAVVHVTINNYVIHSCVCVYVCVCRALNLLMVNILWYPFVFNQSPNGLYTSSVYTFRYVERLCVSSFAYRNQSEGQCHTKACSVFVNLFRELFTFSTRIQVIS